MFALRSLYETAGNIQWDGRKGLHWVNNNQLVSKSIFIRNQLEKNNSEVGETLVCSLEPDITVKKLPSDICSLVSLDNKLVVGTANGSLSLYGQDGKVESTKKLSTEAVSYLQESENSLIAAYEDGTIDILNKDMNLTKKLTEGPTDDVFAVATSSRYLILGGEDSLLRFYDLDGDNSLPIKVFYCTII